MTQELASFGIDSKWSFIASTDIDDLGSAESSAHKLCRILRKYEDVLGQCPALCERQTFRQTCDDRLPPAFTQFKQMPTDYLSTQPTCLLRRSYSVISMLSNAYVWCEGEHQPVDCLPEYLSVPLCIVSDILGIAPITTHYSVVLWNWDEVDGDDHGSYCTPGHCSADGKKIRYSFTGTRDEEWFFWIGLEIEAQGAQCMQLMFDALHHVEADQDVSDCARTVTSLLQAAAERIKAMHSALLRMTEHNRPEVFYHKLRPFLSGWKDNDNLPNGLVYQGVSSQPKHLSGASAAQSTLVAALDLFLGADRFSHLSAEELKEHFIYSMRQYMPLNSRAFLEHLDEKRSVIRDFVQEHASVAPNLAEAFNSCVYALKGFRDSHIIIVTKYITNPASRASTKSHLADKGTGGSNLHGFLKQTRAEAFHPVENDKPLQK